MVGEILARCAARIGYYLQCSRGFPAEIMGGRAWFQFALSDRFLPYWGGKPHLLLTDRKGGDWSLSVREVRNDRTPESVSDLTQVRFSPLAVARQLGHSRHSNLVALGAIAYALGFPLSVVLDVARQRLSRRGELPPGVETAISTGFRVGDDVPDLPLWSVKPPHQRARRLIMNGNEAIVIGSLTAGVEFFCGYPITPASSILEMMLKELPSLGGVALQTEDEMAALAACLGASYAGKRALCATSGPGFALMSELINLAVMAEVPIVIVDVQRSGPATGQPSKPEQADLWYAMVGSPGESPRMVIAPKDVPDALYLSHQAVELAYKHRIPVILLSDGALANRIEAIDEPAGVFFSSSQGEEATSGNGKPHLPLSDRNLLGELNLVGEGRHPYVATGMEHDLSGQPSGDARIHHQMVDLRWKKLWRAASSLEQSLVVQGEGNAEVGILSWGSLWGVIQVASEVLARRGISLLTAHLRLLHPLPEPQLQTWMRRVNWVVIPEGNRIGQLARMVRHLSPAKIVQLSPQDGFEITPEEIVEGVEKVIRGEVKEVAVNLYSVSYQKEGVLWVER